MLGITFHNPATISVFLDRMRFRDCFISNDELRQGEWERKLKAFVDLPSDGRERVVFVESFATLQALLQNGATLETVKVAVYDDCDVLSKVPGANIVDAHINGGTSDTWQLYTVSFAEFNDALASQPRGVPALIRDHEVKEDDDIPQQARTTKQKVDREPEEEEDEAPPPKPKAATLVMEKILDDIERGDDEDDEDEEPEVYEPERKPEEALVALPERDRGTVVLRKRQPGEPPPELEAEDADGEPIEAPPPTGPMKVEPATAQQIQDTLGITEKEKEAARKIMQAQPESPEPEESEPEVEPSPEVVPVEPKPKRKKAKKAKKPKLESYEIF